jgi:hypothetical protein
MLAAGRAAGADAPPLRADTTPAAGGDTYIQLAAERSEAEAARSWIAAIHDTSGILDGLAPRIVPVDVPHMGRLYRLRAGPLDAASAASICARLAALKHDCIVVH